jgi:hypothetical protein
VTATEGAACDPVKNKKPIGLLRCDKTTKKWVGAKPLSPVTPPKSDTGTSTNG